VIRVIRGQKCDDHNRNIESLDNWIQGAIQRFRSGAKNSRIIELHQTNHYVFIADERFTRRGHWSFEKRASSCSMNKGVYASQMLRNDLHGVYPPCGLPETDCLRRAKIWLKMNIPHEV
jgi:hypothetical protein